MFYVRSDGVDDHLSIKAGWQILPRSALQSPPSGKFIFFHKLHKSETDWPSIGWPLSLGGPWSFKYLVPCSRCGLELVKPGCYKKKFLFEIFWPAVNLIVALKCTNSSLDIWGFWTPRALKSLLIWLLCKLRHWTFSIYQKIPEIPVERENGTRRFGSFHWNFSGLNGISEKVVPFSRWKKSQWKICVPFTDLSSLLFLSPVPYLSN